MKRLSLVVVSLLALAVLAGCASNDTTARRSDVADEESARPGRIIVHDIAATPDDIPANAAVAGRYDQRDTPRTAGEIELGRQLGARVADGLDKEILKEALEGNY